MSEEETPGNPIEQLNPDWEMRFVIGYDSKAEMSRSNTDPDEVNSPVHVINQDRFAAPSINHNTLGKHLDLETRKGGFCVRDGNSLRMLVGPTNEPTTVPPAKVEEFEAALKKFGLKIIDPGSVTR